MNAPDLAKVLPDIQSARDARNLAIQQVGVRGVVFPIVLAASHGASGTERPTVARVDMVVSLPAQEKGTHMSRFLEVLHAAPQPLTLAGARELMASMLTRLEAECGRIEMRMPYFIEKTAPVSGVRSLMDYEVALKLEQKYGVLTCVLEVAVPVTSLCPCSKEISRYGAHNQRSQVTISAEIVEEVTLDELIAIAEKAASCELYGLLKRPDEKYVTERAYDNPKFVEDLVRDVAIALNEHDGIAAYKVSSENFESIHNHSAYALIEHDKRMVLP